MKHWPTKPLGAVLDLSKERIEPIEHPNMLFNYVGLESIEGHTGRLLPYKPTRGLEIKSTKNVFHCGEILYGKLRPYLNKVHLASEDGICSTDIYVLRPRERLIHPSFAANYLRSPSVLSMVSNSMAGANLPRISQDTLLAFPVPMPPLSEQERMVRLLDDADELRKLRIQADRRTTSLIPSLFHEMFGDPATNPLRLPVVRLDELLEIPPNYGTMVPARAENGEWLSLRVANIQNGGLDLGDQKFVDLSDEELERHTVNDGDLVLARAIGSKEHLGKCVVINKSGGQKWAFDSHLMRIRLNRELCKPEWLKALFESRGGRQLFLNNTRQSAVQFNINAKEFGTISVPLPPLEEQEVFLVRVIEIHGFEAEQAVSRRRLEDLFQSFLYRAFQGEL